MFNVKSPNSDAIMMIWAVLLLVWMLGFILSPVHVVSIAVKFISVPVFFIFTVIVVKYVEWEDERYERKKQEKSDKIKNGLGCPFCGGPINDGRWLPDSCPKCGAMKMFDKWYKE